MSDKTISRATYYVVFGLLLGLLALTVGAARADLGKFHAPVALSVAAAKAILIVLYFMHVRYSRPLIALVAVASVLWLLILLGLTYGEVASRRWPVASTNVAAPGVLCEVAR